MTATTHRRPPAAPRRGAQPAGVLYGRLPGYHLSDLGRAMAERVAEHLARRGHHPRRLLAAGAGPGDARRRRRQALGLAGRHRRPADRGRQRLRGQDVRRRRRRRCAGRRTGSTCATRSARPGASRTSRSPSGCSPRRRGPRRRARPRGGLRQPPAADLDRPVVRHRPPALARPAQAAVLARVAHVVHLRRRRARLGLLRGAGPRPRCRSARPARSSSPAPDAAPLRRSRPRSALTPCGRRGRRAVRLAAAAPAAPAARRRGAPDQGYIVRRRHRDRRWRCRRPSRHAPVELQRARRSTARPSTSPTSAVRSSW